MSILISSLLLLQNPALRRGFTLFANPGQSISQRLHDELLHKFDDRETIQFKGYVSTKRSLGKSLAFVDLISYPELDVCQALLRREFFEGSYFDGYRKGVLPGTRLLIHGKAAPTKNPGEAVLLIQNMNFIELPRQPQHIKSILSLTQNGELPIDEIAKALSLSSDSLYSSLIRHQEDGRRHSELAKTIFQAMPPLPTDLEQVLFKKSDKVPHRLVHLPLEALATASTMDGTISVQEASLLSSPITVSIIGYVQNRRRFDDNITVVHLVDQLVSMSIDTNQSDAIDDIYRLECILNPTLFDKADTYGQLLTVGFRVHVSGVLEKKNQIGQFSTLWVTDARLIRASWRPATLRYLLDVLHNGVLSVDETADALLISSSEAKELSKLDDLTVRQWQANELSVKLQSEESRTANLPPEILKVLGEYSDIRIRWPLQSPPDVTANQCSSLELGLPGSRWQSKKRPQLEWMVREVAEVVKSHANFGKQTIQILDVGGGKGKLANYLAQSLGDSVQVHVVDIAKGAIHNGAMRAKRLNLSVQYNVADASKTQFLDQRIDVVVALHACGHLSDVALAHAVQHQAGFVICPCCFMSNPALRVPGTKETVESYLGIPSLEWAALKYLAEVQGDSQLSSEAIHTLCAVRADAVSRKAPNCLINIKSFPVQYSTRNICLVGRVP